MRRFRLFQGTALAAAVLLGLIGCGDGVLDPSSGVTASPQFAPGGGRGGGPGGGGSGPSAGKVVTTFADAAGDGIISDAVITGSSGDYESVKKKGQELVRSEISNAGNQHWLDINEGSPQRTLCVVFPAVAEEIADPAAWNDLVAASNDSINLGKTYCGGDVIMHTRDHSEPDALVEMDTDPGTPELDVQTAGGKLVLEEFDGGVSWQWRLFFDDQGTGGAERNGVCIRYNADGTWTIGTDPAIDDATEAPSTCDAAGVDEKVDLMRFTGSGSPTRVATFTMPFTYTLTPD